MERDGILRFSEAATLVGLEAPPAALNLDVKPYAVGGVKADRVLDPAFENHSIAMPDST